MMGAMLKFDEVASRRIEATYLTPDVIEQRRVVVAALELEPGETALDIGSGPGLLATEIADVVGPAGSVHGIDPSDSMLAIARRRPGSESVEFHAGDAYTLPFPDGSFDVAVSTQVYEYVADVPRALAEARRVLRPGGRLLVLDTDWDSIVWRSRDPERMRRVLAAWDEHLVDPYLPRRLTGLLVDAGFAVTERAVIPMLNAGYDENTYSAGLVSFVGAFVPGRHDLTQADAGAWADDLTSLGADYFFSLNRYLFTAVKPAT
jgi:arsenite methyltransferase